MSANVSLCKGSVCMQAKASMRVNVSVCKGVYLRRCPWEQPCHVCMGTTVSLRVCMGANILRAFPSTPESPNCVCACVREKGRQRERDRESGCVSCVCD